MDRKQSSDHMNTGNGTGPFKSDQGSVRIASKVKGSGDFQGQRMPEKNQGKR